MPELLFERDDLFGDIDFNWTEEEMLAQRITFYLKDVAKILSFRPYDVVKAAKQLLAEGRPPREAMGVYRVWGHWRVVMSKFGPYYLAHFKTSPLRTIDPNWDANTLLSQEGCFMAFRVAKCIPFTYRQLRYRAMNTPNARQVMGVCQDEVTKKFLVDMPVFSKFIREVWGKKHEKQT